VFAYTTEHMFAMALPRLSALTAALALTGALLLGHASPSSGASHPRRHMVRAGETLWAIALAGYPGDDPRDAVYRIERANHLAVATIVPGQVLRLP
jgi:nucleoid-associated protein YgaU